MGRFNKKLNEMLAIQKPLNKDEIHVQTLQEQSEFDLETFMEVFDLKSEDEAVKFLEGINKAMELDIQNQMYY